MPFKNLSGYETFEGLNPADWVRRGYVVITLPPLKEWTSVLTDDCGLLVRPYQYILSVFEAGVSAKQVGRKALAYLQLAA